jgi:hypothetical protein
LPAAVAGCAAAGHWVHHHDAFERIDHFYGECWDIARAFAGLTPRDSAKQFASPGRRRIETHRCRRYMAA